MLKIHIIETEGNSYAAAIVRDGKRLVVVGACFDEMLGVVAAAMLRPDNIPYARPPKPWNETEPSFGLTRDQHEELLVS